MKRGLIISISAGTMALASAASAQVVTERESFVDRPIRAPRGAFEITVGGGYTQGFGEISAAPGEDVNDIADAGGAVELDLGYRISPNAKVGAYGQFQEFDADDRLRAGTNVRGLALGLNAQYHFRPYVAMDPWIGLGTGYRMLWTVPETGGNTLRHGFELARLQAGIDFRVSPDVALGPVIGADLNLFVWENPPGDGNNEIDDKRLNTFVFAGVQGRFDVGGTRESAVMMTGSR